MSKITQYFKDTRAEFKHVIWPSKSQTVMYTVVVLVLSILFAYYMGVFDFLFSRGLDKILN